MELIKRWLQVFRAQTAPATILCVMVPYLAARSLWTAEALILGLLLVGVHWFSFGHNSLMDMAMGYDQADPAKDHHPLVAGTISPQTAHSVIYWGLCIITVLAGLFTLCVAPNAGVALFGLFLWISFGHAYNDGLSKESLYGFLAISLCMTGAAMWGWYLSHAAMSTIGVLYLAFVFCTILFQISWSGHLKEMEVQERSNLLIRLGARLTENQAISLPKFDPGQARHYGLVVKTANLVFGWLILLACFSVMRFIWVFLLTYWITKYLHDLLKPRFYNRPLELFNMSMMEILTIYMPIPLILGAGTAIPLMTFGVLYFFAINKVIWGTPYPKV